MKGLINTKRHFLFLLLLALFTIPFFQSRYNFITIEPLHGDIKIADDTAMTFETWFSGEYQERMESHLNDSFGFRNFFVRLNNQVGFGLFRKTSAAQVISGKHNILYEESYIKAYTGADFIGEDSIARQMQKIKFLTDTLRRLNKSLILLFAPGKGFYYPEYIPDRYFPRHGQTNVERRIEWARELNLNYIDFNSYFVANKNSSEYPLYPKNGIHWSYYGACLVTDSLIRYIESLRIIDMPNLYWDTVKMEKAKNGDSDILDGVNLLFGYKPETLAYPVIQYESDSGKTKPSAIVISDSFFFTMEACEISKAFSKIHFWYYNRQIFPESYYNPLYTNDVDLKSEIDKHDIIILMGSNPTMSDLGWGFIEYTYDAFHRLEYKSNHTTEFLNKINEIRNYILNDKDWLEKMKEKAQRKNITVDSMITLDAIWILQNK